MQKKTEEKIIDVLCIIGFITFIILGIIAVLTKNVEFIYDRFFSAMMMGFVYIIHRKINLKWYGFSLVSLTLVLHHLKLYGYVFFYMIEFDMIMHFLGGFSLAVVLYGWLKSRFTDPRNEIAVIAVFAFLAAIGLTASNEIIEYFGAYFLGSGQGLLYYGAGDFGAYADTAWDLICNTVGAFCAMIIMGICNALFCKKTRVRKK